MAITLKSMDARRSFELKVSIAMHLRILSAIDVPRIYEAVLNNDTPERDLALKKSQMQNLRVQLQCVTAQSVR